MTLTTTHVPLPPDSAVNLPDPRVGFDRRAPSFTDRMVTAAVGDSTSTTDRKVRRLGTIRFRLTLLYAAMFLACGVLLLGVSFVVVRASLTGEEGTTNQRVIDSFGYTQQQVRFFTDLKVTPPPIESERNRDVKTVGDVILITQQEIRDQTLHQLILGSSISLGAALVLSVVVGWLAAGRALAPVGRITSRAKRLSEDNLNERLDLDGPRDELTELADTLDGMLSRLEVAFNAQRRFAANVSHEVRTPMAIMRGEADLALADPDVTERERAFARTVRNNVDRTEALLESLLALARSQSNMNECEVVDLAELAGDVLSERVQRAIDAQIHVDLELGMGTVRGDPWLLERLLANLVDNAITHNRPGGWMTLVVGTHDNSCRIEVHNSGDRLTSAEVDAILQPFRRAADNQRPGYGLGMTIVQSVAKAHGGNVAISAREEGGLDVTVEFASAADA